MNLTENDFYPIQAIIADLTFIEFIFKTKAIKQRENTGLKKLIDNVYQFLDSQNFTLENNKVLSVFYTIVDSLKSLWLNNVDFKIQLRAMNTGKYDYGIQDPEKEHFFKDFEFELFSAAQLVRNSVPCTLPQNTVGDDIELENFSVQCKHPKTTNQISKYLDEFTKRLNQQKKYGIFGLAVEDCFEYGERISFNSREDFGKYSEEKLIKTGDSLHNIFNQILPKLTRILGVYFTSSFFVDIGRQLQMVRFGNSILCFRPNRKEIKDDNYRTAYRILQAFNPYTTWLTFNES